MINRDTIEAGDKCFTRDDGCLVAYSKTNRTSDDAYCNAANTAKEAVRKFRSNKWDWSSKRGQQVHQDIMVAIDALDGANLLVQDEGATK